MDFAGKNSSGRQKLEKIVFATWKINNLAGETPLGWKLSLAGSNNYLPAKIASCSHLSADGNNCSHYSKRASCCVMC